MQHGLESPLSFAGIRISCWIFLIIVLIASRTREKRALFSFSTMTVMKLFSIAL